MPGDPACSPDQERRGCDPPGQQARAGPLVIFGLAALAAGEVFSHPAALAVCYGAPGAAGSGRADSLLVVGDPQLTDFGSYRQEGWLLRATEALCDVYLRRAYTAAVGYGGMGVLFLGDLFDTGHAATDAQWAHSLARFDTVFGRGQGVPHYHTPGNHDLGQERADGRLLERQAGARRKWTAAFGPDNAVTRLPPVPSPACNPAGLDGSGAAGVCEDPQENPAESAPTRTSTSHRRCDVLVRVNSCFSGFDDGEEPGYSVLASAAEQVRKECGGAEVVNVVVATHVPLQKDFLAHSLAPRQAKRSGREPYFYEPELCGDLRTSRVPSSRYHAVKLRMESRRKRKGGGGSGPADPRNWAVLPHKDYVSANATAELLRALAPDLVLTGHDHDWCDWKHPIPGSQPNRTAREVTVGTASWLQGNPSPSLALLTFGDGGVELRPCFLPSQWIIFECYSAVCVLSALYAIVVRMPCRLFASIASSFVAVFCLLNAASLYLDIGVLSFI
ncbi:Cell division control protein 1 [Diplonema papillatum]|nr:Cell division control protein 1 [Diplonema papillatum]